MRNANQRLTPLQRSSRMQTSGAGPRPHSVMLFDLPKHQNSLGLRLIDRDSHACRLTDEGVLLRSRTEGPLAELPEGVGALTHDCGPPCSKLRVCSPLMFGHLAMGAIAAGFVRRFLQRPLQVKVEDQHVDLIDEGYDMVIRINPCTESQLVGRCFHLDELLLVAPVDLARPSDSETAVPTVTGSSAPDLQKRSVIA
jgi:DNA-binding transcriptional LysR family regulator